MMGLRIVLPYPMGGRGLPSSSILRLESGGMPFCALGTARWFGSEGASVYGGGAPRDFELEAMVFREKFGEACEGWRIRG